MTVECVFCGAKATDTIELGIRDIPVCEPQQQNIASGVLR